MMRIAGSPQSHNDQLAEQSLLLACARTQIDPATALRIPELTPAIRDWFALAKTASAHKVWPLLYRAIASNCPDAVPASVLDSLRKEYVGHSARNLRRARDLLQITKTLHGAGIPCLPYKGPVLAESVYGDVSLRQFVDLDILARRRDVAAAVDALTKLGYALHVEQGVHKVAYLQSMHHYTLSRGDGGMLELHWDIAERYFSFSMPAEALWERRETARIIGQEVFTLGAEDNLIALAAHGCRHGWEQLGLVCDVAELLRARPDMDWELALRRARGMGGERMVLLALHLASRLLGAAMPDLARQRMEADPAADRIAADVQARLFAPEQAPRETSERVRHFRLHTQARERFQDRARSLLHLIFTPSQEDWEALRLPNSLAFLHYILRPLRLAVKHAGRIPKRS